MFSHETRNPSTPQTLNPETFKVSCGSKIYLLTAHVSQVFEFSTGRNYVSYFWYVALDPKVQELNPARFYGVHGS